MSELIDRRDETSVVLLSGGVDSVVLAASELQRGTLAALLCILYGQPAAQQESDAAQYYAGEFCVPLHRITVNLRPRELHLGAEVPGPRIVPGRNALLLALGVYLADQVGAKRVLLGATRDDWQDYRDCRLSFANALSGAFSLAYGIRLEFPFHGLTHAHIIRKAGQLNLDLARAWSCYEPLEGGRPCGGCNSCIRRSATI